VVNFIGRKPEVILTPANLRAAGDALMAQRGKSLLARKFYRAADLLESKGSIH
jgi:hypothetical protein